MTKQVTTYDGRDIVVGRPYKLLDPDVRSRYIDAIRRGAPQETACGYAGITSTVIIRNRRMVEELGHEEPEDCNEKCEVFCQFFRDVRLAKAQFQLTRLDNIANAPEWQSDAWMLERTDPANFAKTERLQVQGGADEKLDGQLTDEQKKAMAEGVLQTLGAMTLVRGLISSAQRTALPAAIPATPIETGEAEVVAETVEAEPSS